MKFLNVLLSLIFVLTLFLPLSTVQGEEKRIKVVSTLPDFFLIAREIGGGKVEISSVMPPGADPHSYALTQEDMKKLSGGDLLLLANSDLLNVEKNIISDYPDKEYLDFNDYKRYGASLKDFPSSPSCPHGYWLGFENTLAVAKAVRDKLTDMDPGDSDYYMTNYENFQERILRAEGDLTQNAKYMGLYGAEVVTAIPGINYIISNFGMKVGATLLKEGSGYITGKELSEVESSLKEGRYVGIVCPISMKESKAGEISQQISKDTGAPVAYVKFLPEQDSSDPIAVEYYNLASLSDLLNKNSSYKSAFNTGLLLIVIASLSALAAVEAYIIYRMRVRV